jgi:hypothetical protein
MLRIKAGGRAEIIRPDNILSGVYKWYFTKNDFLKTLYIGRSSKSTFDRGISEAYALNVSSVTPYTKLDTDYIIGTCIDILTKALKCDVYWEHVSNNPKDEASIIRIEKPLLQKTSSNIDTEWKCETKSSWSCRKTDSNVYSSRMQIWSILTKKPIIRDIIKEALKSQ